MRVARAAVMKPMRSVSPSARTAPTARWAAASAARASGRNRRPAGVGCSGCAERSISSTPSFCSSLRICWLRAGVLM
ncbi:Uncharacterised protein [Mycobacteroides abscessus subsp. abscessus]|nr:Uncharacterised protein [Mycobacteroides abscessus subsp. abscessus]